MRRALATAAIAALVLGGCANDPEETPSEVTETVTGSAETSPSASPTEASPSPTDDAGHEDMLAVEIKGDEVEPRGKRVQVAVGEEVVLRVESDRAAELHVHSSPEQTLEVTAGETVLTLTVARPGVVDVEEHETGIVVLQLEVR